MNQLGFLVNKTVYDTGESLDEEQMMLGENKYVKPCTFFS